MNHNYDNTFFDWVDSGANLSAKHVLPLIAAATPVASVVDVGCGRGAWLDVWRSLGVEDVIGLDGDYVDRGRLAIPLEKFVSTDLAQGWSLDRRFDLAQSLEVAEHLPESVAETFVVGLCRLSDVVLFSAASPGQGGEMHINEKEPQWWSVLFAANGYAMFDYVRPKLAGNISIEPWYRYNIFLYANETGCGRLSAQVLQTHVRLGTRPRDFGNLVWRMRCAVLRKLSPRTVTTLSRLNYQIMTRLRTGRKAS